MDGFSTLRCGEEPFMQLDRLQLRNYFPHEVEKLSVVQITQTRTFDEIGHPIRGGLYDPLMGPGGGADKCETCGQFGQTCPGHFGHIRLDVPVFQPMLYQLVFNLMKGSCLHCHRMTCGSDNAASKALLAKLRCFDFGVPLLSDGMDEIVKDLIDDGGLPGSNIAGSKEREEQIDTLIRQIAKEKEMRVDERGAPPTKNCVEMKKAIVRVYLREQLFRRRTKCPLCKGHNGVLRNDNARSLLIDFSSKREAAKKKTGASLFGGIGEDEEEEIVEAKTEDKKAILEEERALFGPTAHSIDDQLRAVKSGACQKLAWRGAEVREHFRLMWKNDGHLLQRIFPMLNPQESGGVCPLDGLFCEHVLVPPTKFRPMRLFAGENMENPQTVNLRKLLEATETIRAISLVMGGRKDAALNELIMTRVQGKTHDARMHNAYLQLQLRMNAIFDENLNKADPAHIPGIKQLLEKKQGLFRMNMMGKRVNYACRSVITPDPYLDIDEIGIPDIFARKLTFSEAASEYNVHRLKQLVETGEGGYPGANAVLKPNTMKVQLAASKSELRNQISARVAPPPVNSLQFPYRVLRHVKKGDMMMMNRQPSLHKPSIMGHRARILTGQRALRMNYAPCKAYNADFDGDEMNGHLVQSYVAQTEVAEIASVSNNFLVPKDATPLLGLIQDHVVSGVLLTMRGRFLTKEDMMHLVLASFAESSQRLHIPPPCILKPVQLWSGKQVISAILKNCIPKGKPLINLTGKAKTPLSCWKVQGHKTPPFVMSESEVVIRQAELLVGVLDKAHYGATQYGLGHCLFELYGNVVGVKVLSCFSRLFTTFLQLHGFTLGVADILVKKDSDKERKKAVLESRTIGDTVARLTFAVDEKAPSSEVKKCMAATYCSPSGPGQDVKMLDFTMKQNLSKYNDAIVQACVPEGLIRSFPSNALQLMIQSGAKGSAVNAIQISCNLGQIELEGKRMGVTVAGRTLPSFKPFDTSPRAGGYIDQRFLTGINPQELFFHTMAGREGLIDTAVKTSRSGYLQRCIIKHLEGIKVHYDQTVRDHDGSVVQFRYGEDGMDVCKSTYLTPSMLPFINDNLDAVTQASKPHNARDSDFHVHDAEGQFDKVRKWKESWVDGEGARKGRFGGLMGGFPAYSQHSEEKEKKKLQLSWREMEKKERKKYDKMGVPACPRPVDEKFNAARTLGALPEKMLEGMAAFTQDKTKLKRTLYWKGVMSLADPGENVGLLAAQSIGEPSTQMTLNTFHFAGRGEMNVTLGIPRLREILMTASKSISTPSASINVLPGTSRERIDEMKREFDRVYLKSVLSRFTIEEKMSLQRGSSCRLYILRLQLLSSSKREQSVRYMKRYNIMRNVEQRFIRGVVSALEKKKSEVREHQQLEHRKLRKGNLEAGVTENEDLPDKRRREEDGASSDEEAEGGKEADASESRLNSRHKDDGAEYEGEEEEKSATKEGEKEEGTGAEGEESDFETDSEGEGEGEDVNEEGEYRAKMSKLTLPERIQGVMKQSAAILDFRLDAQDKWCEVTIRMDVKDAKLDVASIVEKEVATFIVSQTKGIERCIEREDSVDGKTLTVLQTQGVNLEAFYKHSDVLDVNSLYTNDLNLVLNTYGVEACSRAIVNEMKSVFGVYGIEVSTRHLSLTADHMTFTGEIAPFNRGAMSASSSPLQKMTFETTIAFMREALITGEDDMLESPSSRLVVGSLNRGGTGAFDLLMNPSAMLSTHSY